MELFAFVHLFFFCALSVVYRGQGLFFFFFSFVCSQRRMWKILSLRQAALPPPTSCLQEVPSLTISPLSLSLSFSHSMETLLFFLLSPCHPAGLQIEIGETGGEQWARKRSERERDIEANFEGSERVWVNFPFQTLGWIELKVQVHVQLKIKYCVCWYGKTLKGFVFNWMDLLCLSKAPFKKLV